MPTPFPGMDPYLEHPQLWPDVHSRLITGIGNALGPRLSPRYVVSVEERVYIASVEPKSFLGRADVSVSGPRLSEPAPAWVTVAPAAPPPSAPAARMPLVVRLPARDIVTERYLEVRDAEFGHVITVLEILSPGNKRTGSVGYHEYLAKRDALLASTTSLVEIDLLRAGERPPLGEAAPESDYRLLVHRGWRPGVADLYAFGVRDAIPLIPIPLRRGEDEPLLDLNSLLHALYDQAVYSLRIHYDQPPTPPLAEADATWVTELLRPANT